MLPPLKEGNSEGLVSLLSSFSRSEQRTAGYMLGERLLLDCPTDLYWQMTEALVHYESKAYLITLMKTFLVRLKNGSAGLSDAPFCRLAAGFNEVERQKVALLILPELGQPQQVEELFAAMGIPKGREQMVYLVRVDTLPCLFLLLRSLRYIEHDRSEVLKVARQLMKRGTGGSFNLGGVDRYFLPSSSALSDSPSGAVVRGFLPERRIIINSKILCGIGMRRCVSQFYMLYIAWSLGKLNVLICPT